MMQIVIQIITLLNGKRTMIVRHASGDQSGVYGVHKDAGTESVLVELPLLNPGQSAKAHFGNAIRTGNFNLVRPTLIFCTVVLFYISIAYIRK